MQCKTMLMPHHTYLCAGTLGQTLILAAAAMVCALLFVACLKLSIRRIPDKYMDIWEQTVSKTTPKNKFKIVLGFCARSNTWNSSLT